jgi:cell fate regulator YaaT (PSP1 superfamily)
MNLIGVRFAKAGKIYHFDASSIPDIKIGESVVVETSRGWQLGRVTQIIDPSYKQGEGPIKKIERRASARDLVMRQTLIQKESDIVEFSRERIGQLGIKGVKIVSAEYSLDGCRLTVMFCTDTEEKVDLKSLRQDIQKRFTGTQVELRQVGPRDVAKTMCGMGACGLGRL